MLKKKVRYENYDGDMKERDLYFHLSQTEIIRMVSSGEVDPDQLESAAKREDPKELFEILLFLVDRSYGIKSQDGELFTKNDVVLETFKSTAAYDALVKDITQNEISAVDFFKGIFPKKAMDEALKNIEAQRTKKAVEKIVPMQTEPDISAYEAEIKALREENARYRAREVPADAIKTRSSNVGDIPGRAW